MLRTVDDTDRLIDRSGASGGRGGKQVGRGAGNKAKAAKRKMGAGGRYSDDTHTPLTSSAMGKLIWLI